MSSRTQNVVDLLGVIGLAPIASVILMLAEK
jgi:hypothetical protein